MAFVLTYDGLVNIVTSYLERNDTNLLNNIPNFVLIAQRRIASDLKTLLDDITIVGKLTLGDPFLTKPNQWLNTISFNIGLDSSQLPGALNTNQALELRTYEFCLAYWPQQGATATPKYYADYDYNSWYICPTPDQAYPYETIFSQIPTAIDTSFQVNFITEFAPHLLEYATLREAMIFIKDDERIQFFESAYQTALAGMTQDDKKRLADRFYNREAD
jgi:hypothetical protein